MPDRDGAGTGELICLITTITDPAAAPAAGLAQVYHQRWDRGGSNEEIKTQLRGPGQILRSKSPDLVRAEIYGYLLCHYAISALIARAARGHPLMILDHGPGGGGYHSRRRPFVASRRGGRS